tara:strand:- start:266 stop:580 length:315 start_codon:yes stop_codon:yes gene_type:complete
MQSFIVILSLLLIINALLLLFSVNKTQKLDVDEHIPTLPFKKDELGTQKIESINPVLEKDKQQKLVHFLKDMNINFKEENITIKESSTKYSEERVFNYYNEKHL